MGSPLPVVFANLYLACLEEEQIDSLPVAPLIYKRFIDDIFAVIKGSTDCETIFLLKLNNLSPTINRTNDMGEAVPFLDLVISKGTRFKSTGILDGCMFASKGAEHVPLHHAYFLASNTPVHGFH